MKGCCKAKIKAKFKARKRFRMPRVKLSAEFVKNISTTKPKEKYQDATQNGLVLRVTPTSKVYYFISTITIPKQGKKQIEKKIGNASDIPLSVARETAKKYMSAYTSQSDDPIFVYTPQKTKQGKACKLDEIYNKWLDVNQKYKESTSYENTVNAYSIIRKTYTCTDRDNNGKAEAEIKGLGDLGIDIITTVKIKSWQQGLLEHVGLKPSTINRVCVELKRLLHFALDHGLTPENYQVPDIPKLSKREIDPKTDYFKSDEIETLLEGINRYVDNEKHGKYDMNYIRDIMLFLLYTGLRPASVCGLQWRDIDFNRNIITMRAANIKTKRTDTIVPSEDALEILHRLYDNALQSLSKIDLESNVFTNYSADMVCRKIKKVLKYIFGPETKHSAYTFRHTFATHLAQVNPDMSIIKAAMNHRRVETTLKYISVDHDRVASAVNKLPFGKKKNNS